jgi:hypothetical protein
MGFIDMRNSLDSFTMSIVKALVVISAVIWFSGCASKKAYTGHSATDLSSVEKGALRITVESVLGTAEKVEDRDGNLIAWYIYDRGFIGNLEQTSVGEKLAWAPVMAWGEIVSLGLAGWMTACQGPCQKGWLIVEYDQRSEVVNAVETFLPDSHPLVVKCATSAVRGEVAVCEDVRQRIRPSSLPVSSSK